MEWQLVVAQGGPLPLAQDAISRTVVLLKNVCSSLVIRVTVSTLGTIRRLASAMRNSNSKSENTRRPRMITWAPMARQNSTVRPW